ncbi:Uncharacterised protein [Serratia fonticola]|nr:Uncharacterised protein [Serratia fonticola]
MFAAQRRRLKEAEGEKDIAGLLQWKTDTNKYPYTPGTPQAKLFGGTIGGTNQNPTR